MEQMVSGDRVIMRQGNGSLKISDQDTRGRVSVSTGRGEEMDIREGEEEQRPNHDTPTHSFILPGLGIA